ncbi:ssDNA binding domain protein [Arthrobacter phage Wheelbite]|uniref:SsDNA binding domain protein n=1 Tax=Arthrobacter phage Wheelbite TaxID=2015873 RepID=A0A222ZHB0_9CAUD|nr:ssDNA binding domain protein [Arthrobacter phage Wheelbite]ASR84107.1 ssDNA binding domain protein [Arthrobacter phage Wheelbite]
MAGETTITVIGNLTNDPELRFTPGGDGVANFTIASTPRTFDRQANEWKDGETLFLRASAWRELSENVAESLVKGMRVIASGKLKSRSYETKEGEKRTVIELEVEEIGPSLKYATAKVQRTQRTGQQGDSGGFGGGQQGGGFGGGQQQGGGFGGQQGGFGGQQQPQGGGGWGGQPQTQVADDPWATPGVQQNPNANGWGTRPQGQPGAQVAQSQPQGGWQQPQQGQQPPQQQQNPNGGWGGQPQQGQQGEPPF